MKKHLLYKNNKNTFKEYHGFYGKLSNIFGEVYFSIFYHFFAFMFFITVSNLLLLSLIEKQLLNFIVVSFLCFVFVFFMTKNDKRKEEYALNLSLSKKEMLITDAIKAFYFYLEKNNLTENKISKPVIESYVIKLKEKLAKIYSDDKKEVNSSLGYLLSTKWMDLSCDFENDLISMKKDIFNKESSFKSTISRKEDYSEEILLKELCLRKVDEVIEKSNVI